MKISSIILFSENPQVLVDYYKKVLEQDTEWSGGEFHGFVVEDFGLIIGPHDKVTGKNPQPERIMFNIETDDVEGEFERIRKIPGTQVIAQPYHPMEDPEGSLATLADPDGNYFQLATPFESQPLDN